MIRSNFLYRFLHNTFVLTGTQAVIYRTSFYLFPYIFSRSFHVSSKFESEKRNVQRLDCRYFVEGRKPILLPAGFATSLHPPRENRALA
jgi:hypothetical protein